VIRQVSEMGITRTDWWVVDVMLGGVGQPREGVVGLSQRLRTRPVIICEILNTKMAKFISWKIPPASYCVCRGGLKSKSKSKALFWMLFISTAL